MHEMKTKKRETLLSKDASWLRKKNKNKAKAPTLKGSAFLNNSRLLLPNDDFKWLQPL